MLVHSSHLRSAHDNVRKKVGIPNCFTMTKTSDKSYFQQDCVLFTKLIKEKASLLPKSF